ncbi:MAG: YigZ family protein [Treponema sp.]|nr:YigZ family protein [Treponema sp.]
MKILKSKVQTETIVKGSRFLAEAIPCQKQEEARSILKSQKEKYSDATHVVHAFMLGKAGEVMGMSDDGEPGGTAGRPVLDVLKGSGATDIMLTVTRWFGGTLLGTGGLVKAYGGAAKELLSKCQEIGALEEYVPKKEFSFECDYALYKSVKRAFDEFSIDGLSEEYADKIRASAKVPQEQYAALAARLKDLSKGKLELI